MVLWLTGVLFVRVTGFTFLFITQSPLVPSSYPFLMSWDIESSTPLGTDAPLIAQYVPVHTVLKIDRKGNFENKGHYK